ncbi:MAG TPA: hypothetical protein VIU12_14310 [Chryseolinea sp.]
MNSKEQEKDETPGDDLPFVNDECGDFMWDEALKKFEENEKKKAADEKAKTEEPRKQDALKT